MFHLNDGVIRRQTGLLHNLETSYLLKRQGFFNSVLFKAGYELEVDNESFFYKATVPNYKDERLKYKVRRNQVYLAVGLSI